MVKRVFTLPHPSWDSGVLVPHMHMPVRFQASPPFFLGGGGYMRLKLNQNLETEAAGSETPPYLTGIATEADFPLELPRAVLPLSQSIRVWVTGQKPGSSASHTCHSPGMQAHLQEIPSRAMSRSPSASPQPAPRPSCHPLPLM